MTGYIRGKETFPKIGKFMKKSDGFMEDRLRFPRKYECAIMICILHVSIVISSLVIFINFLHFLGCATLFLYRDFQVFKMGGEPRKQELSNYRA